jgi:hypothetical protein
MTTGGGGAVVGIDPGSNSTNPWWVGSQQRPSRAAQNAG